MTEQDALALLRELTAMVRAECPSLLNEDSGGDARLSLAIDDALAAPPPDETRDGSVMVRVDLTYVEHMRRGGLEGPFARIELDESGSAPRLILTVAQAPTPDSVEWWRSVAAGLGVEIQKLKDLASAREPETFPEPVHRRIVELEAECAALKAAQAPPPDPPHDCEAWRATAPPADPQAMPTKEQP
jgi:hypothetical protein